MDVLDALLGAGLGATTTLVLIVGAAATLLAYGISLLVADATHPVRRRLASATDTEDQPGARRGVDLTRAVDPLAKYVLPKNSDELSSTQRRLEQAGFRSPTALKHFYGMKAALALALPFVALLGVRFFPQLATGRIVFIVALAAFIGMWLPDYVLTKLRERRVNRLRKAFPDALDLLVVCVESGLGLGAAIERVARELDVSHEELAHELALVNAEIRAGVERPVALRNLARRSGVEDISGLVGLLIDLILGTHQWAQFGGVMFGTIVALALAQRHATRVEAWEAAHD